MKHKITFFAVLMMALAFPQSVKAYDFSAITPSGHTLYYNISGNNVTVAGPSNWGYEYYYGDKPTGTLTIPNSVTNNGITYTVTSIGNYAFCTCNGLTSVTIPSTVTSIGNYAFSDCSGLISVTIPNSVSSIGNYAFQNCGSLTSITLPDAVTSIGNQLFYGCSSLATVTIGSGLTSIGSRTFEDCNNLTAINVSASNTAFSSANGVLFNRAGTTLILCPHAHVGNLTIGLNVSTINADALNGCTIDTLFLNAISCTWENGTGYYYNNIELPTVQVLEVGEDVDYLQSRFTLVPGLQYINVNEDNWNYHSAGGMLVSANGHTVKRCPAGRTGVLVMPAVVTRVADSAFIDCLLLTAVDLNNVRFVGRHAFKNSTGLQSITIPATLDSICDGAFANNGADTLYYNAVDARAYTYTDYGSDWGYYPTENASLFGSDSLKVVIMGNGVQNIPPGTFYGCTQLQSVTLPSGMRRIGINTFRNCSSLASISLSDSLVCIDQNAFWGCSSLTNIVFPAGLDTIGNNVFKACTSLANITLPDSLHYIGANAFEGCSAFTSFTVPPAVRHIGSEALKDCPNLKDLYYNAVSVHQWDTVSHRCQVGIDENGSGIYDWCIDYIGYRNGEASVDMLAGTTSVERMVVGEGVNDMTTIWQTGVDTLILPQSLKFVSSGYSYYQGATLHGTPGVSSLRYVYFNCKNLSYHCWSEKRVGNEDYFSSYVWVPYMHEMAHGVFPGAVNMRHVIFGDSVQSIPAYCFRDCRNIREFVNLTIPSTVTYIGGGAFDGCTQIRSANIHSGVTHIGTSPFLGCRQLSRIEYNAVNATDAADIDLPDVVTYTDYSSNPLSYDNVAHTSSASRFSSVALTEMLPPLDTLVIGAGVREITPCLAGYPWQQTLDSVPRTHATYIVNQSTTLQTIGVGAFANMWLTNTQTLIGDSLKVIGDGAFRNSRGFSNINLPQGVTTVGSAAFMNCADLDSVVLPSSVQIIGKNAFAYDSSLSYLYYNCDSAYIDFDVDHGQPFGHTPQLSNIVFGPNVRHLTASMFMNCEGINDVIFNEGLLSIGAQCFFNTIASSSDSNYPDTSALRTITLPSTLLSIGEKAFIVGRLTFTLGATGFAYPNDVSNIDTIFCRATTPPILESDYTGRISDNIYDIAHKFGNVFNWGLDTMAVLVVPCGSLSAYSTQTDPYWETGWITFASIQETMPFDIQLTVNVDTMGTVSQNCIAGGVQLTAVPSPQHRFLQWSDGVTDNPRTVVLNSDTSFEAQFAWGSIFNVTASSANASRGSVTGSGSFVQNTIDTLVATANYGYHFDHWNDGDTSNPRYLTVTTNTTLTATFLPNQYTLAVFSADSTLGSVSGGGNYDYNTNHSISATPVTGYHFAAWNDGSTANPRSVHITQDTSFTASFAPNIYTLTVSSANSDMGSASADNSQYTYGDTATVTAIANYGYHFSHWNDGDSTNPRQMPILHNTSLTAHFAANTYTVTLTADSSQGTVSGSGEYEYLTVVTLSAISQYGYHFTFWSDSVTLNPRPLTLTQDTLLSALFDKNQYILHVAANDVTMGSVSGGGSYEYLQEVTLTASANTGYRFIQWQDGDTQSVRTVTVTGEETYTAYFEIDSEAQCPTITSFPWNNTFDEDLTCWKTVDADGDGYNWGYYQNGTAYSESYSYFDGTEQGLNPDNWIISRKIKIPTDGNYTLSWRVKGMSHDYYNEHYTVYVSTSGDEPADFTQQLFSETLNTNNIVHRNVSLQNFNGQTIRVAFRHHNCSDVFVLGLDNIKIALQQESIVTVNNASTVSISVSDGRIIVDNSDMGASPVHVYDVMGRQYPSFTSRISPFTLPDGVYLVKVGGLPARRVVVIR